MPSREILALYERLIRLTDSELGEVVFRSGIPAAHLRADTRANRANDLIEAAEARGVLPSVEAALTVVAGPPPIRVAVVGVREELAEALVGVERLLRLRRDQVAEVVSLDLAAVDVLADALACPLRVVLLGVATGGPAGEFAVNALLQAEGTLAARRNPVRDEDLDRFAADFVASRPLLRRVGRAFTEDGAAEVLRVDIGAMLDRLVPRRPGGGSVATLNEEAYLRRSLPTWLRGWHGALLDVARKSTLERARLYVSLNARFDDGLPRSEGMGRSHASVDSVLSLAAYRVCLVVGDAGAGKTVLVQHIAAALALHHLGAVPGEWQLGAHSVLTEARLDLGELAKNCPLVPIPIVLEARELAQELAREADNAVERLLLRKLGDATPAEITAGLATGRYAVLVDSLDEVPGASARRRVLLALEGLAARPGRLVLTSRPGAHTQVEVPASFKFLQIAPLDDALRARMVGRWADAQGYSDSHRAELEQAVNAIRGRFPAADTDRPIESNPLLLTCIFLVFQEKRRLPDNTADLYKRMIEILCETRAPRAGERLVDGRPEDADLARKESGAVRRQQAQAIAAVLQRNGGTALAKARLATALRGDASLGLHTVEDAEALVDRIVATTGIFREEEAKDHVIVRPWHRSFLEYLAAAKLAAEDRKAEEVVADLVETGRADDASWRGCLSFLVGAFGQVGPERAQAAVRTLLEKAKAAGAPRREGRLFALAAAGAAEYQPEYFDGQGTLLAELARWSLNAFADRGARWRWRDRATLLDALGSMGLDDRWADPRRDSSAWIQLPAWSGWIGEELGLSYQPLPITYVDVQPFFVLSRPVTVRDYLGFVEAGGYLDEAWWRGPPLYAEPARWWSQQRVPSRPLTGVSVREAEAFCRWATSAWKLPIAGIVDLPTSVEWESIARREGGTSFPWGDMAPKDGDLARAAYSWGSEPPDGPAPVGVFAPIPRGSGRIHDLVGNVWEWTRTEWRDPWIGLPQHHDPAVGRPREARGGSWLDTNRDLRCASRACVRAEERADALGFRVVLRPHTS